MSEIQQVGTERAMETVARWFSGEDKLKINWHKKTNVCADIKTKTLYIPIAAASGSLSEEALMLLRAKIYHESAHILETDESKFKGAKFKILNALEDVRIENKTAKKGEGISYAYSYQNEFYNKEWSKNVSEGKVSAFMEATAALIFSLNNIIPAWALTEKAKELYTLALPIAQKVYEAKNTKDVEKLAEKIYDIWKDKIQEDKKEQEDKDKNQDQDDSEDQEKSEGSEDQDDDSEGGDGESESENDDDSEDSENGENGGKGEGSESDEEDKENKSGSSGDGDDNDEGKEESDKNESKGKSKEEKKEPKEENGEGEDKGEKEKKDPKEPKEPKKGKEGKTSKNLKPDKNADPVAAKNAEDELEKAFENNFNPEDLDGLKNELEKAMKDPDFYTADRSHDNHVTFDVNESTFSKYEIIKNEINNGVMSLVRNAEQAFYAMKRTHVQRGLPNGNIDLSKLTAISKNLSRHVYLRKVDGKDLNTCVSICIDQSGSMSGSMDEIKKVIIALGEMLDKICVPFEIFGTTTFSHHNYNTAFTRYRGVRFMHYKTFGESWNIVKSRIVNLKADNNNIDGESVEYAAVSLAGRKEKRKIVFSVCDGLPESGQMNDEIFRAHLKKTCERVRKAGIEVYSIGLDTDRPEAYYGKENFIQLESGSAMFSDKAIGIFTNTIMKGKFKVS